MRYPYIAVIGDKEATARTLSVRSRQDGELGAMPLPAFAERLLAEAAPPRRLRRPDASVGRPMPSSDDQPAKEANKQTQI